MNNIKKKINKKRKFIKISGGYLKGKKIFTEKIIELRPTTCFMRRILFEEWLKEKIKKKNCLDCFAGSGILSFEALSRNANSVTLIESNKRTYNLILKNIKNFKKYKIKIINLNFNKVIKNINKKFDLIFLDPPFKLNIIKKSIFLIDKYKIAKKGCFVYVESNIEVKPPKEWKLYKKKKKNKKHFNLYKLKC
ncbi:MAG: 16S rRNA (guanine(966)-N(2))-methyltransferase RsmD [Enterobacteriaceae bacterium]